MTSSVQTATRPESRRQPHKTSQNAHTYTDVRTYEQDRQRHVQARDVAMDAEMEKMEWPLERLHALRDARLRSLVRHAKTHSPWHARRLRDVDPDRLTGDDLTMIPPMTKTDLMENWDEIVTDRRLTLALVNQHLAGVAAHGPAYLLDEYHVVASGGSSGLRGIFVWDFAGWLSAQLAGARHMAWLCQHLGLDNLEPSASVGAASPIHMTVAMSRAFGGPPTSQHSFPVTLPLAEIVAGLNRIQPAALFGYPSILPRLALEARVGRLHIAPRLLTCGAEPLAPGARQLVEEVFGAPLIDWYGSSETWAFAGSFPGSSNLHLIEDVVVCEPIDRMGSPVPPGQTSATLLVTNVINRVLPLIRYELTDEVTFLAEPNPDPWVGRRIAPVEGRRDHLFTYPGGITVHPHVFRSALTQLPDVCEYQVHQTQCGADIAVRAVPAATLDNVQTTLIAALRRLGLGDPQITIRIVDDLPRKADTGKLTRFIPLARTV